MLERPIRLEDVKKALATHKAQLKEQGVKTLSVFGSVARGEASPGSDVDMLVEFEPSIGLFHFIHVQNYLKELLGGVEVDLVIRDAVFEELQDCIYGEEVNVL